MARKTTEQFIEEARQVHGDKYDYSKVVYNNCDEKVEIICKKHGVFYQSPYNHCRKKQGCPKCAKDLLKNGILGYGINDLNDRDDVSYRRWRNTMVRCYYKDYITKFPTYIGCSVCEEWKYYSKFKQWFDKHYVEGWHLDKDILVKGNKVYSPDTCCFVPSEINSLFNKCKKSRGQTQIIGVTFRRGHYIAKLNKYGQGIQIGVFDDKIEAFNAYKKAKEDYIKEMADKWKDRLEPRVYEALYNYKVEITD